MPARTLPTYGKPPVVEVAISVYFLPPPKLSTVRIGEFWIANRAEYPKTEDNFPIISDPAESVSLPPIRRVFMITDDERYVLQLQQNCFIHNWRKIKDEDEYPRFDSALTKFKDKFERFQEFVRQNDLGPLIGHRYEVTYVNHLQGSGKITDVMDEYIGLLRLQPASDRKLLPSPSSVNADVWFDLPGKQGTLRLSFKQGARASDQKEVLQVELTARGQAKADFSDMDNWLEVAHEWIVQGFSEITTETGHARWEKAL